MRQITVIQFLLVTLLCSLGPAALQADTMYSFTGTYTPYSVSISFDTSLSGSALDFLTTQDITSTVSGFSETNTIGGVGSASLKVILSTDGLGNITAFNITDTLGQVVTNTTDTAPDQTGFVSPSEDLAGRPLQSFSTSASEIFARYESVPNDFFCKYYLNTGLLKQDHDEGFCAPVADIGSVPGVSASGGGTFTSNPPNPGAPSAVPEVSSFLLLGTVVGLLALIARLRPADLRRRLPTEA
jgi:hypothetical protein